MKKISTIFLVSILFITNSVLAVGDDFTIKFLVGEDTTPPSIPNLLSAVPIATTQIDLAWSASTDNFLLGGYVVLRDGTPIATTTLISFSDTGLLPETLYSYEVYAFDNTFNISSTSNMLATTTLAVPIIPPSEPEEDVSKKSSSLPIPILQNLFLNTSQNQTIFEWNTNLPTRFILRFGKNNDYDGGYISNEIYRQNHKTILSGLEPDTIYFYELVGVNYFGVSKILKVGEFKTKAPERNIQPPNVLRLQAVLENNYDVRLHWQLPLSADIASVRVVQSHLGYPIDINDGLVIYDGIGVSALDKESLRKNSPLYYTVFLIDNKGEISSGAVTMIERRQASSVSDIISPSTTSSSSTAIDTPVVESKKEMSLRDFDANNINLFQNKNQFTFLVNEINLNYQDYFIISIGADKLSKHLKSIVVTLLDPTDHRRSYSFLLKINKDKTAYEATIAPLMVLGASRLSVEIFDFDNYLVGYYQRQINFVVQNNQEDDLEVVFPDKIIKSLNDYLVILFLLFIFIVSLSILYWWQRRRTEDN